MAKQRGCPDRRGMGAESDALSEQFVPSELYKEQQRAIAQTLTAAGLSSEKIANMLFVPLDLSPIDKPDSETPESDPARE